MIAFALRCVALRCAALRCVVLRCAALRCAALRCAALLRCAAALRCALNIIMRTLTTPLLNPATLGQDELIEKAKYLPGSPFLPPDQGGAGWDDDSAVPPKLPTKGASAGPG